MTRSPRLAALWTIALLCGSAAARDRGAAELRQLPLWELGVGVGGLRLPDYRGSAQSRTYLLPLPYFVYRGERLRADRDGARALLVDAPGLTVDVSLAAMPPARGSAAREGMEDLPARLEVGPNANLSLWRAADSRADLELRTPLRAAVTLERAPRSVGWTFNPHLSLNLRGAPDAWDTTLQAGAVFGDRRLHSHVYGVSAAQATAQRPAFDAHAGYAGWLALAGASRRFDHMWVGAFIRYDGLRGAVIADSPLVQADRTLTAGFAVAWIFSVSDRLVTVPR
jgi:MipA family protein